MRGPANLIAAVLAALALGSAGGGAAADAPAFDLAGPALRVTVTRAGAALPIAQTPDLAEGDSVTVRADLPDSQSAPYLLVLAFLRGATNPPPREWFSRAETWSAAGRAGVTAKVPPGARQALVFLVPRTSGDYATVVGAVRGRPGAFVRAAQDLTQASLDRSRLTAFLAALRLSQAAGPEDLKTASPLLARSLDLKLNPDCLQRAPEGQAACLLQGHDALVLSDGHSRSIVEALTGGPASDLALHLSASPAAGYGATSPYVGAVLDIARLLDSLRTAQFQYVPALEDAAGDRLSLVLNAAPSFQNPRSVIVAALPPVGPPQTPPLHAVEPDAVACLARPDLVLPVTGAPLVFSTAYAHDLVLHAFSPDGRSVDAPVSADAAKGGLVVGAGDRSGMEGPLTGVLRGSWGFARFEGPTFRLQGVRATPWRKADGDGLVVGRDDEVRLEGPSACVTHVRLRSGAEPARDIAWKAAGADAVAATAPLADAKPGPAVIEVAQFGSGPPQGTAVQLFTQAARLDGFGFHAGDDHGVLKGSRLDTVSSLAFAGADFTPGALSTGGGGDELTLAVAPAAAARLTQGRAAVARVTLKDGRSLRVAAVVGPPRLQASLIAVSRDDADAPGPLRLAAGDLPRGARLTFSVRAEGPVRFSAAPTVEVAAADAAAPVVLTPAHGLTVLDAGVLVARLDTAAAFTASAYGPLRFRVVQDGVAGDWRPLGVLVRTPVLRRLRCPERTPRGCELEGDDLFLIEAVSSDPDLRASTPVAAGYTGRTLATPRPRADGRLFLRLHDDPARPATLAF